MASKTPAQVISQLQSYVAMWRILDDTFQGAFANQLETMISEIVTGDQNEITEFQLAAMRNLATQAGNFYRNAEAQLATIAPTLGELAGAPSPGSDYDADLAFLHDYLIDNSKAVPTRGFTKATWTADGSNTGNGRILQLKTDVAGDDIDCAHPDPSLRLRCLASAGRGVTEGQEPFELIGSKVNRPWEDDGIGNLSPYEPSLGKGFNDFGSEQLRIEGVGLGVSSMRSMSGSSPLNLLGTNGSFEAAFGSGDTKISGFTFISGESNTSAEETAPLVGSQSLKIDGNCVFYSLLNTRALYPKTAIAFGALVKKVISSSTLTGTLTIVLRSGGDKDSAASGTAHKTITVTIGSLTDNTTTNEDATYILPAALGADPRIEFTVTSYTDGSGTANSLLIDEAYAARMYQVDMGQFLLPVRGTSPWELDDFFTSSVTDANDASDDGVGKTQEFLNRVFGRYLKHSAAGTDWVDPTLAPEIQAYNSSGSAVNDGGSIALGSVTSGAHSVTVQFENTGNYPLALALPTTANASNASLTNDGMDRPIIIMPNRKYQITVEVTNGGAGAFSIDVIWPNNDSSEDTYAITLSGTAT